MHPTYGELRPVTPLASVLLAPNPSPMTLEGTNTWVLRAPDEEGCVVVDPGDDDPEHLERAAGHGPVTLVLLTHRHHDHAAGARRFAELTGAPVRALDPSLVLGSEALGEGDVVAAAGLRAAGAGDARAHVGLAVVPARRPGDGVRRCSPATPCSAAAPPSSPTRTARWGPTSARCAGSPSSPTARPCSPGHGPELPDAPGAARHYLAHREERLDQVRTALEVLGPAATARQVVEHVYTDVDEVLWGAAELSVRAQLEYLRG